MNITDDIGARGEAIFEMLITRFCGRQRPMFRAHFLGDKKQTLDYLVELIDSASPCLFFVQVRATALGLTRNRQRLRVQLTQSEYERLLAFPGPTYIVGIDVRDDRECGYIVGVTPRVKGGFVSLPTGFPLDCDTMNKLWLEVEEYWSDRDMVLESSCFNTEEHSK